MSGRGEEERQTFLERTRLFIYCRTVVRCLRVDYAKSKVITPPRCCRRLAVERPDIAGDFRLAGEGRHTNAVQQMVEAADRHVCARDVRRRDQDQHTGLQEYV